MSTDAVDHSPLSRLIRPNVFNSEHHAAKLVGKGEHGIDKDVFLSVPCVLNANGVTHVVKQLLTETEIAQLQKSANLMHEVQTGLKF